MSFSFNTTPSRSRNMRAIKAISNFSTEGRFRAHLVRSGISGWKLRVDTIVGRPDFFSAASDLLFLWMAASGTDAPSADTCQNQTGRTGSRNSPAIGIVTRGFDEFYAGKE